MEISLNIFLFFWMEKKLILSSHICNIECMRLVLWLWSFELNGNSYGTKNCPFWVFNYCERNKTIFIIVDFFFSLSCLFWTVLHIFELLHIFNCKFEQFHEPRRAVQEHLNLSIYSIARLNSFMNRAGRFKSI